MNTRMMVAVVAAGLVLAACGSDSDDQLALAEETDSQTTDVVSVTGGDGTAPSPGAGYPPGADPADAISLCEGLLEDAIVNPDTLNVGADVEVVEEFGGWRVTGQADSVDKHDERVAYTYDCIAQWDEQSGMWISNVAQVREQTHVIRHRLDDAGSGSDVCAEAILEDVGSDATILYAMPAPGSGPNREIDGAVQVVVEGTETAVRDWTCEVTWDDAGEEWIVENTTIHE